MFSITFCKQNICGGLTLHKPFIIKGSFTSYIHSKTVNICAKCYDVLFLWKIWFAK